MSFWGDTQQSTSFELGSKPIPDNTSSLACIEQAEWKEWEGERYINIKWRLLGGDFENRVVFQKIKVFDVEKGDRAKQMLAAIDANAGGKLFTLEQEPQDSDFQQHLTNKMMNILIGLWEINGNSGNWVKAVSPQQDQSEGFDADVPF